MLLLELEVVLPEMLLDLLLVFLKGINFINIPTTLLQVDSAIGGKTGVNSDKGKI